MDELYHKGCRDHRSKLVRNAVKRDAVSNGVEGLNYGSCFTSQWSVWFKCVHLRDDHAYWGAVFHFIARRYFDSSRSDRLMVARRFNAGKGGWPQTESSRSDEGGHANRLVSVTRKPEENAFVSRSTFQHHKTGLPLILRRFVMQLMARTALARIARPNGQLQ